MGLQTGNKQSLCFRYSLILSHKRDTYHKCYINTIGCNRHLLVKKSWSVVGNGIEINRQDVDFIIELEQRLNPLNSPTGIPTWVYQ